MNFPAEAIQHALDQYPKESVGYLKDGVYTSLDNVSETPEDTFVLSAEDVLRVHEAEADFLIHSHPKGAPYPSAADMESQMENGIPYGIIVMRGRAYVEHFTFGDQIPVAPLLGRQFRHGVHDCYALVRDWYRLERDILLPVFPRDMAWWHEGGNLIEENFASARFEEISDAPKIGDVHIMAIGTTTTNHLGIDIGQGLILHHLYNRLSRREPILPWKNHYVKRTLRYVG
jgi:proteasome lid subunit RPN8/RPN11